MYSASEYGVEDLQYFYSVSRVEVHGFDVMEIFNKLLDLQRISVALEILET
jgi:hypothetical protein